MPAASSAISGLAPSSNILILWKTGDARKGQEDVQDRTVNKGGTRPGPAVLSPKPSSSHDDTHQDTGETICQTEASG